MKNGRWIQKGRADMNLTNMGLMAAPWFVPRRLFPLPLTTLPYLLPR
jgi:hypothetical protein